MSENRAVITEDMDTTFDTSKYNEFYDAGLTETNICTIIGVGAVGSHIAAIAARMHFTVFHLYDFDIVNKHNLGNQAYEMADVGRLKVEAARDMILRINPNAIVHIYPAGAQFPWMFKGIIFLCADKMEVRRNVLMANMHNPEVVCFLDSRMRLTDAQHYFADPKTPGDVDYMFATMDFTDEEAKEATPVSACGVEQSVVYTVQAIAAISMANLINFLRTGQRVRITNCFLNPLKLFTM